MVKSSIKFLFMIVAGCGIIGIQAQLSDNNQVFASSLVPCCNNGICQDQPCAGTSSLSDCDMNELETITCQQCLDLEYEDVVPCPQNANLYCRLTDNTHYKGGGTCDIVAFSVAISGTTDVSTPSGKYDPANSYTWTASPSISGTYTYTWYKSEFGTESIVGTGNTHTENFSWAGYNATGTSPFTLRVVATRANPTECYATTPVSVEDTHGVVIHYDAQEE